MRLPDESVAAAGEAPATTATDTYAVNIDGLSDFACLVDREVGNNLDPSVKSIHGDHLDGLHWGFRLGGGSGQWCSDVVNAARVGHNGARYQSSRNLQHY